MLYSVIIPCYRSDQTIEHVVNTTREEMNKLGRGNVEFVLVNDCSPDGGKTIAKLIQMAEISNRAKRRRRTRPARLTVRRIMPVP